MSSASEFDFELATRTPLPLRDANSMMEGSQNYLANDQDSVAPGGRHTSLAPVDGGFKAWSFLAGAFIVEGVVWSLPFAYGVFLTAYLQDPSFASQKHASSLLPLVGNLTSGIIYCSGPFVNPIINRSPKPRRPFLWVGALICCASLFGASYASKVEELLLLQGVLYGIGGALLYDACMSFLSEWFVEKRGLATGVIFAGTAVGGLFLPLLLPRLITQFGLPGAMRVLSVTLLILLLPSLPFLRPRLPESRIHGPAARARQTWWRNQTFVLVLLAVTMQGFAYFVPITWLPTFASELQLSDSESSLALALLNGSALVSQLSIGYLADRYNAWLLSAFTTACTALATFVLWGVLSNSLGGLLAFGIAYGSLAGGWSTLIAGFVRPIAKDDPTTSTTLFGLLMFSRGLGNILSTPISSALSRSKGSAASLVHPSLGYKVAGGRYESMIVYVGTCFVGATVIAMIARGMEKNRRV